MKNIPNVITIFRMLLSVLLFFVKPLMPLFLLLYFLCGFSDFLDGYIARKTNSASNVGAVLDSIADFIFIIAAVVALIPVLLIPKGLLVWIVAIALVRFVSILVAYCKYHEFAIIHTYANKATGFFIYCFPYFYLFVDINILGSLICTLASISAVEELIIHSTSKELARDIPGIWVNRRRI